MDFFDAHFHLMDFMDRFRGDCDFLSKISGISCALQEDEFLSMEKLVSEKNLPIKMSFGIHPLNLEMDLERLWFLEKLLEEKRIQAIGEVGFDFFTLEGKSSESRQSFVFESCLDLAIKYGVPLVIHNRKALDKMFFYARNLSKVPLVIFHSFPFSSREAKSLLDKNINARFSFGKPLLAGNKKQIDCIKNLPLDRILLETDAPYQTLRDEEITFPCHIQKVYQTAADFREMDLDDFFVAMKLDFAF